MLVLLLYRNPVACTHQSSISQHYLPSLFRFIINQCFLIALLYRKVIFLIKSMEIFRTGVYCYTFPVSLYVPRYGLDCLPKCELYLKTFPPPHTHTPLTPTLRLLLNPPMPTLQGLNVL